MHRSGPDRGGTSVWQPRLPVRAFRSRGNRTEALCRAKALDWNATAIGAIYNDHVHRYLGSLQEGETPVGAALHAAEQAALVMMATLNQWMKMASRGSCKNKTLDSSESAQ